MKPWEVMKAFDEGAKIEYENRCDPDGWEVCPSGCPVWNWHGCDYRVLKEPKTYVINSWKHQNGRVHTSVAGSLDEESVFGNIDFQLIETRTIELKEDDND